jgi:hypothetical protein
MVQHVTDHTEIQFKCAPLMAEQLKWEYVALHNVDIASNLHGAINRIYEIVKQLFFSLENLTAEPT